MRRMMTTALAFFVAALLPAAAAAATACLVLSRQIPPYAEAAKGFRAAVLVALGRRGADDWNAKLPKSRLPPESLFTEI